MKQHPMTDEPTPETKENNDKSRVANASVIEAFRALYESGGSGWDAIDDPENFLEGRNQMRIYLAARYSRRLELCGYRDQLREMGHEVQAVWLDGEHQIDKEGNPIGEQGESLVESQLRPGEAISPDDLSRKAAALRAKFAGDDFRDVLACDLCISFTEPPRTEGGRSRGGRHVEFGIALGLSKRVIVVGHRENIFHWLGFVQFFESWEDCMSHLRDPCIDKEMRCA